MSYADFLDWSRLVELSEIQLVSGTSKTLHTTIASAIAASVSGDVIYLPKGRFAESVSLPSGVHLIGLSNCAETVIEGVNAGSGTRLTIAGGGSRVSKIGIDSATNSDPAIVFNGAATVSHGHITGGSALSVGVDVATSERVRCSNIDFLGSFAEEVQINTAGATFMCQDSIHQSTASSSILVSSVSSVHLHGVRYLATGSYTTAVDINAAATVKIKGSSLAFGLTNAMRLRAGSDGCSILISDSEMIGTVADWLVDSGATGVGTSILGKGVQLYTDRISASPAWIGNVDALVSMLNRGENEDDGQVVIGKFSVGVSTRGAETAMGEGNSTTFAMFVYSDDGTGTSFLDKTADAKDPATSFSFQGTSAGEVIYWGNPIRSFMNIKFIVDSVMVLGSGSVVWEYWNGSAWTEVLHFAANADEPREHRAKAMWETIGAEHLRFNEMADQALTTVNGLSAYWLRARIASAITTAPVFSRTKLGTNRTEYNSNGYGEHFGTAEPERTLFWHRNLEDDLTGASPVNSVLDVTTVIRPTPIDNSFQNGAVDGNAGLVQIPGGLDTSRPLRFSVQWKVDDNNAGDVELQLYTARIRVGDILDQSIPHVEQTEIFSVSGQGQEVNQTEFYIDVSDFLPNDTLAIAYRRDATNGNLNDTYAGDLQLVQTLLFGRFWR